MGTDSNSENLKFFLISDVEVDVLSHFAKLKDSMSPVNTSTTKKSHLSLQLRHMLVRLVLVLQRPIQRIYRTVKRRVPVQTGIIVLVGVVGREMELPRGRAGAGGFAVMLMTTSSVMLMTATMLMTSSVMSVRAPARGRAVRSPGAPRRTPRTVRCLQTELRDGVSLLVPPLASVSSRRGPAREIAAARAGREMTATSVMQRAHAGGHELVAGDLRTGCGGGPGVGVATSMVGRRSVRLMGGSIRLVLVRGRGVRGQSGGHEGVRVVPVAGRLRNGGVAGVGVGGGRVGVRMVGGMVGRDELAELRGGRLRDLERLVLGGAVGRTWEGRGAVDGRERSGGRNGLVEGWLEKPVPDPADARRGTAWRASAESGTGFRPPVECLRQDSFFICEYGC